MPSRASASSAMDANDNDLSAVRTSQQRLGQVSSSSSPASSVSARAAPHCRRCHQPMRRHRRMGGKVLCADMSGSPAERRRDGTLYVLFVIRESGDLRRPPPTPSVLLLLDGEHDRCESSDVVCVISGDSENECTASIVDENPSSTARSVTWGTDRSRARHRHDEDENDGQWAGNSSSEPPLRKRPSGLLTSPTEFAVARHGTQQAGKNARVLRIPKPELVEGNSTPPAGHSTNTTNQIRSESNRLPVSQPDIVLKTDEADDDAPRNPAVKFDAAEKPSQTRFPDSSQNPSAGRAELRRLLFAAVIGGLFNAYSPYLLVLLMRPLSALLALPSIPGRGMGQLDPF